MKHTSVALESPIELINVTPLNPLISKCQIKVCYVQDEPNRNRSVITKEVAKDLANSLPGSPIVGFYDAPTGDFIEHNRQINIANGKFEIKDTTKPYGFVDLNAKVWFQKFLDDDQDEREYLMTEGWLWTGQYPECQRVIDQGNNQSMELSDQYLDAEWTKDKNGKPQFFIINEAIISKLCILGEDVEPCFEGSTITKVQFSFEDSFTQQLFSMMNELKQFLNEGGAKMPIKYAVEIGDALWSSLWRYVHDTYPDPNDHWSSIYSIDGIYEENTQKFAILQHCTDRTYYRLNFTLTEEDGFKPSETLIEVTKTYTPAVAPQFDPAAVQVYATEYKKSKDDEEEKKSKSGKEDPKSDDEDKEGKDDSSKTDESTEEDDSKDEESKKDDPEDKKKKKKTFAKDEKEVCPKCGKPIGECTCEDDDDDEDDKFKKCKKKKYNLDEIDEYVELENQYHKLQETNTSLMTQIDTLTKFKAQVEHKAKEEMITSFYMLSDEDKKDVITNIDTYSLDDIEAKLSIICVRNKVSFDLDKDIQNSPTTFNLNNGEDDALTPAWVKAAMAVAKNMNQN